MFTYITRVVIHRTQIKQLSTFQQHKTFDKSRVRICTKKWLKSDEKSSLSLKVVAAVLFPFSLFLVTGVAFEILSRKIF